MRTAHAAVATGPVSGWVKAAELFPLCVLPSALWWLWRLLEGPLPVVATAVDHRRRTRAVAA
jgi:hypothetical protein